MNQFSTSRYTALAASGLVNLGLLAALSLGFQAAPSSAVPVVQLPSVTVIGKLPTETPALLAQGEKTVTLPADGKL